MTQKAPRKNSPEGPTTKPTADAGLFDSIKDVDKGMVDIAPSEKLKKVCGGCRLSFSWFRTAKMIDKATKLNMANAVETSEGGFSAAKRLMDSKHPVIKEANELRGRIHSTWMSYTLPLAAASTDDIRVEGGCRLIRRDQIAEFDKKLAAFKPEVAAMQKKVNDNLEDIKETDKQRLKGMFRDDDYPAQIALDFSWGYPAIAVPSYLEKISPEIYQRELAGVTKRFEKTFELAYMDFLGQFQGVIASWVDRLGPVVRIHPEEGNPHHHLYGAELLEKKTHGTSPEEVPEGKVAAVVRYRPPGKTTQVETTVLLDSEASYADLRPSEIASERKTFKDTTIEAMSDMLAKFRRLGSAISADADFTTLVQQIETHLARCSNVKEAARELRDGVTFRSDTHQLMKKLDKSLAGQVENFKKMRRKLDVNFDFDGNPT